MIKQEKVARQKEEREYLERLERKKEKDKGTLVFVQVADAGSETLLQPLASPVTTRSRDGELGWGRLGRLGVGGDGDGQNAQVRSAPNVRSVY